MSRTLIDRSSITGRRPSKTSMCKHCDGCLTARRSKLNGRGYLGQHLPPTSAVRQRLSKFGLQRDHGDRYFRERAKDNLRLADFLPKMHCPLGFCAYVKWRPATLRESSNAKTKTIGSDLDRRDYRGVYNLLPTKELHRRVLGDTAFCQFFPSVFLRQRLHA